MYEMKDTKTIKALSSPNYNFVFDKVTGFFARWGKTEADDPDWSPYGPEILDLEISTGECKGKCRFCYKENGQPKSETHHMQLHEFEDLLSRMPPTLTQVAFGITDVYANPDFFAIMRTARDNGVIPNYTTHGLDMDEWAADETAALCGAVAVSVVNKEKTYDCIKMLTDRGMSQVNIHFMLSNERIMDAMDLIEDIDQDPRLSKLNAVVFLQYKPKGDNTNLFTTPTIDNFQMLVRFCDSMGVRYGFDSCTAPMYMRVIEDHPNREALEQCVEPCESGLFSSYINSKGEFFACSFCEGETGWTKGISVFDYDNFVDLWRLPKLDEWRKTLLANKRACPMYQLGDGSSGKLYGISLSSSTDQG
jgi:MoaA/NifB/PqqE/SkfB family radical SAM enzyme